MLSRLAPNRESCRVSTSNWPKDLLLALDNSTITLTDLPHAAGAWMRSLQTLNAEQTQDLARAGYESRSLSDIVTMVRGPVGHWKGRADRDARSSEGRPLNVLLSRQKQAINYDNSHLIKNV